MLGLFDWLFGKKPVKKNNITVVDKPKKSAPVNNNTPPFDAMQQWIKDNWRSIEVVKLDRYDWKVSCELFTVVVYDNPINGPYEKCWILCNYDGNRVRTGFTTNEINKLVNTYVDILEGRQLRLEAIRTAKQRKKMADKLKQLGYGDGSYE